MCECEGECEGEEERMGGYAWGREREWVRDRQRDEQWGREGGRERKWEPVTYVYLVNRERESNQIESRARQNKAIVIKEWT